MQWLSLFRKPPLAPVRNPYIWALLSNQSRRSVVNAFGVKEVSSATVQANFPCEDKYSAVALGSTGLSCGVYDGHSGRTACEYVSQALPNHILQQFKSLREGLHGKQMDVDQASETIKKCFQNVDDAFCDVSMEKWHGGDVPHPVVEEWLSSAVFTRTWEANTGCVAVNATCTPDGLYVANCGDACAALITLNDNGEDTVAMLTEAHTGDNQKEVDRIHREQKTNSIIQHGRVLGRLQPTRAFGDREYKLTKPPFVTPSPDVHFVPHDTNSTGKQYLVLASDGVWDVLDEKNVAKSLREANEGENPATVVVEAALWAYGRFTGDMPPPLHPDIDQTMLRGYMDDITCLVLELDPTTHDSPSTPNATPTSLLDPVDI
eukprot:m.23718 g.23718  ORF g.23718 m.23718 type:complete len:376 (-) comp8526_c0_seq1:214-1341(-)